MPKTLLYRFDFKGGKHHKDISFLMVSTEKDAMVNASHILVSGGFQEVYVFTGGSGFKSGYTRKAHYPAENHTCLTRWIKF